MVKTIFLSVQTGMVVRDLLRCGPLDRVLSHPDARVVLLTPGVRDPAFVAEFGPDRGRHRAARAVRAVDRWSGD